jgi:hypothetical protein
LVSQNSKVQTLRDSWVESRFLSLLSITTKQDKCSTKSEVVIRMEI